MAKKSTNLVHFFAKVDDFCTTLRSMGDSLELFDETGSTNSKIPRGPSPVIVVDRHGIFQKIGLDHRKIVLKLFAIG